MPNYAFTTIIIHAQQDRVEKVLEYIKTERNDFDFNTLIPMPEKIKNTSAGSHVDYGFYLLTNDEEELTQTMSYNWKNAPNNLTDFKVYLRNFIGEVNIRKAKEYIFNLKHYGFKHWHDWSIANWGTKWNACDVEIEDNKINFSTAWDIPEPILIKLSETFPNIKFEIRYTFETELETTYKCDIINGKISNEEEIFTEMIDE